LYYKTNQYGKRVDSEGDIVDNSSTIAVTINYIKYRYSLSLEYILAIFKTEEFALDKQDILKDSANMNIILLLQFLKLLPRFP